MGRKTTDPEYYENNSFADDLAEAKKNGTLIRAVSGKSIIDVARESYMAKKKSETVSIRLPKPLVATIKLQAAKASVPWTSYIREVLERTVAAKTRAASRA